MRPFTRRSPERNTFPDHLPRERVVIAPPKTCECCGGGRLRKLGEDVTRTRESEPRRWKVIETAREKFTCRDGEKISQGPAPFHCIPRAWAGPSLLAMIATARRLAVLFEKFGQHQPLNRQAERYALEGVPIALSTMADAVGAVCAARDPLRRLVEAHVLTAERLHGDDTTVPVLALGKTDTGRLWTYVRDDRLSPAPDRQRRSSTPREIDAANIRRRIWPVTPASCKPTLTTATTGCICPTGSRGRSGRRRVRRDNQDETAPFWPLWKEGRSPTVIRAKMTRAGKPAGLGVVAGG